jgi:hypothetical protein
MLTAASLANFIDLQIHIFVFSILISFSITLVLEENTTRIGVGLDHLVKLPAYSDDLHQSLF